MPLTPDQISQAETTAAFPAARFNRIGLTQPQIAALAAQWVSLPIDQRIAQAALIEQVPDNAVALIAAAFPAALSVGVIATQGVNPPVTPNVNDLWYNVNVDQWQRWNGTAWVASSGGSAVDATARTQSATAISTANAAVTGISAAITTANTAISTASAAATGVAANTTAINTLISTVSALPTGGQAAGGALVIVASGGVYALRNTVTTSTTTPVEWRGPIAPTIGGGYMLTIDTWTNTGAVT